METNRPVSPAATLGIWSGRLYLWPGRALYVGSAADTAIHSHHAAQICVGLTDDFRVRTHPTESWRRCDSAVIPSDLAHQIDGGGALMALIYLDPESEEGRTFSATSESGFGSRQDAEQRSIFKALRNCIDERCEIAAAAQVVDAVLGCLNPPRRPRRVLDSRVDRLLPHIRERPGLRMPAAEAAALTGLSSTRFQHLFRESTGIPFRRYLLWLRLVAAVERVATGSSLTEAAHGAGFADSAHLSRSFRRMFGLTPSALAKDSQFVQASSRPTR